MKYTDDSVFVRDQDCHGKVLEKLTEPRSYKVTLGNGTVLRRNRRSLIHTGLDNRSSSPTKSPTPKKKVAGGLNVTSPESTEPVPRCSLAPTSTANTARTSPEQPGSSDQASHQTTRLGRVIKCTRKPDMIYYK